jgi:hypothetical protein
LNFPIDQSNIVADHRVGRQAFEHPLASRLNIQRVNPGIPQAILIVKVKMRGDTEI